MSLDNIKSLKENLKQNVIHIKNFSEVDGLLYYFSNNSYVVFDSISLKNYFINNTERCVINCNSSYDKFFKHWGISLEKMPDYMIGLRKVSAKFGASFKAAQVDDHVDALG